MPKPNFMEEENSDSDSDSDSDSISEQPQRQTPPPRRSDGVFSPPPEFSDSSVLKPLFDEVFIEDQRTLLRCPSALPGQQSAGSLDTTARNKIFCMMTNVGTNGDEAALVLLIQEINIKINEARIHNNPATKKALREVLDNIARVINDNSDHKCVQYYHERKQTLKEEFDALYKEDVLTCLSCCCITMYAASFFLFTVPYGLIRAKVTSTSFCDSERAQKNSMNCVPDPWPFVSKLWREEKEINNALGEAKEAYDSVRTDVRMEGLVELSI